MINPDEQNALISSPGISRTVQSSASAVSWSAVLAGAAAAAALSLILLMLGAGLGLSSVSPWAREGVSATGFGVSAIMWIALTQILASGMGGYLAGRLRTRWIEVHPDEAHFRDTAHGFLAWAVASLATAALLTSAIGAIVNGGVQGGATVAGGAATAMAASAGQAGKDSQDASHEGGPLPYLIDSLFRPDGAAVAPVEPGVTPGGSAPTPAATPAPAPEVSRIFVNALRTGNLPADDAHYIGQLVAQRTGLSEQDAEKRVSDTYNRAQAKMNEMEANAKDAADKARKASAHTTLWLFISLLIGAFFASLMATFGGRRRDL